MLQFVFLAVLASMFVPNHSFGLSLISESSSNSDDASSRLFLDICSSLCERHSLNLETFQIIIKPTILCRFCKRKGTTTTTTPVPKTTLAPSTEAPKTMSPSAAPTTQDTKTGSSTPAPSSQAATPNEDGETTAPPA